MKLPHKESVSKRATYGQRKPDGNLMTWGEFESEFSTMVKRHPFVKPSKQILKICVGSFNRGESVSDAYSKFILSNL